MMRLFRLRHMMRTKRSGITSISFQTPTLYPSPMSKRCIETEQIWRSPRDSLHRLTRPFLFLRTNKLTRICFQTLSNLSSTAFAWSSFRIKTSNSFITRTVFVPTQSKKSYFSPYIVPRDDSFWRVVFPTLQLNPVLSAEVFARKNLNFNEGERERERQVHTLSVRDDP